MNDELAITGAPVMMMAGPGWSGSWFEKATPHLAYLSLPTVPETERTFSRQQAGRLLSTADAGHAVRCCGKRT